MLTDSLHKTLEQKYFFVREKEQRIERIKKALKGNGELKMGVSSNFSAAQKYKINLQLYEEYKKFNADSALCYAGHNLEIARSLDRKDWICQASLQQSLIYSMCGSYKEAEAILQGISLSDLPSELLTLYYETYSCFWDYYSISARYSLKQNHTYGDSLFAHLDPTSYSYKVKCAFIYVNAKDSLKAERAFQEMLATMEKSTNDYAMLTNSYATMNACFGNWERAKKYLILSAITDIRNATRETLSLQTLAWYSYLNGDLSEAFRYTQSTMEDMLASGINFRSTEVYRSYSIISTAYRAEEERTRTNLFIALCSVAIGCLLLVVVLIYIYRQIKKIQHVRQALAQSNGELLRLNEQLSEMNEKTNKMNHQLNEKNNLLQENNNIKEYYITQFFDVCFSYIHKMERNQNVLFKLAINKSYAELVKKLKSSASIEEELDALYFRFDTVFLSLYPTFVEDFNSLLRDEEKVVLKPDALLNRELRIYALLRLGISDTKKIANFLCCSTSTVYNYRTKMRNKVAREKDNFEAEIMKIGSISPSTE